MSGQGSPSGSLFVTTPSESSENSQNAPNAPAEGAPNVQGAEGGAGGNVVDDGAMPVQGSPPGSVFVTTPSENSEHSPNGQGAEGGVGGNVVDDSGVDPTGVINQIAPAKQEEEPPGDQWKDYSKIPISFEWEKERDPRHEARAREPFNPSNVPRPRPRPSGIPNPPQGLKIGKQFAESSWSGVTWNYGTIKNEKGSTMQVVVRVIDKENNSLEYRTMMSNEREKFPVLKHKYILRPLGWYKGSPDVWKEEGAVEDKFSLASMMALSKVGFEELIVFPKCDHDLDRPLANHYATAVPEEKVKVVMGQIAQAINL